MDFLDLPLAEALAKSIEPSARVELGQYFLGLSAKLIDRALPRVAESSVAEDKYLFGYLSALSDLTKALQAEPQGDVPATDSNDGMLL